MARFKKGNPGGPGRPPGSKNKNPKKADLEELWSGSIATLRSAVAGGDVKAAQFVIERFVPSLKSVEHSGSTSVEHFLLGLVKGSMEIDNVKKIEDKTNE